MKHLTQFEIDGEYFFDESCYEEGDHAIVMTNGSVFNKYTILKCEEPAKNGLPPLFCHTAITSNQAHQYPEYIEPLWVHNTNALRSSGSPINSYNIKIPFEVIVFLIKDYGHKSDSRIRQTVYDHNWSTGLLWPKVDKCKSYSELIELLPQHIFRGLELLPNTTYYQIFHQEYESQRTRTNNTTGHDNNVLRSTATVVQGDNPTGRSCSTRSRARIAI